MLRSGGDDLVSLAGGGALAVPFPLPHEEQVLHYNIREYAKRRTVDGFRDNFGFSDPSSVAAAFADGNSQLEVSKRQVIVYSLYAPEVKSIMEARSLTVIYLVRRYAIYADKTQELQELVDIFSKVEVNIPLLRVIKYIPMYTKFLKDLCVHKKLKGTKLVSMGKTVLALIQSMPQKCKESGVFTRSCVIGDHNFVDAMLDLGVSINAMLKSIFLALGIKPLQLTGVAIQLVKRSFTHLSE
ncbi:hypothetical protein ZIOFF_065264 [Zingiber officinale]|uniref:Complex 1 LYR protein domain-containing protein n=1 Tax=Zingiber officinale TaxID=94328 RepID=A0A8J5EX34_ZINOF|nr:hypothetical protein ZIOFF_065264 [Zingiber officinale]